MAVTLEDFLGESRHIEIQPRRGGGEPIKIDYNPTLMTTEMLVNSNGVDEQAGMIARIVTSWNLERVQKFSGAESQRIPIELTVADVSKWVPLAIIALVIREIASDNVPKD